MLVHLRAVKCEMAGNILAFNRSGQAGFQPLGVIRISGNNQDGFIVTSALPLSRRGDARHG